MDIERLNEVLRQRLGSTPNGMQPKIKWARASEVFYYFRPNESEAFERRVWANFIMPRTGQPLGDCWMLVQWRPPLLTEDQWKQKGPLQMRPGASGLIYPQQTPALAEQFPYPANGEYYGQPETALPFGMEPTDELTNAYAWLIDAQLSKDMAEHARDIEEEGKKDRAVWDQKWNDMVAETYPAFGNWEPGKRGGHISFGGTD